MRTLKISNLRVFEAQKHGKFYQKFYFVFPCPQTFTIVRNPCKASPYPGKRTLALESLLIASKRLAGDAACGQTNTITVVRNI